MKFLTILIIILLAVAASATIINIPDDYATIQAGIDASTDGDTVLVQPGTYVENINFNGHNIVLGSLFLTTGDTSYIEQTVIDGDSSGSVVTFENNENYASMITGFTIQNGFHPDFGGGISCLGSSPNIVRNIITENLAKSHPYEEHGAGGGISCRNNSGATITDNLIKANYAYYVGGGVYCENSYLVISNNTIESNIVGVGPGGGGIYCNNANPLISYNLIIDNYSGFAGDGGGMSCWNESHPMIINNTFSNNLSNRGGAGIHISYYSNPVIVNTLFWGDSTSGGNEEIKIGSGGSLDISYSVIAGGWEGEGNIDLDPLFVDPENSDFHLLLGSPCIDTGDPESPNDPDSTRADIGAFYYNQLVEIEDIINKPPMYFALSPNYPNPFNASTTIKYELPHQSQVTIDIYDILGRRVTSLVDNRQSAGYHQAIWQADDFSSGMYFYKLQAGDYTETKKMLMLK
ncbi:MAG: T9SS type A sorting domain-containing protein [candidate division Zixibacteria bacterium]|nr:T9SS type A sorting domain-containing protein [candidate division Zixibacteria bacterium]